MKTSTDVLGKPVISLGGGAALGTVEDLLFSENQSHVLGFSKREPPRITTGRARLVTQFFRPQRILEPASEGYLNGFWSTFLVRPSALTKLALRGIYMSSEQLSETYQEPPSWRLHVRRLGGPLRELRDRIGRTLRD